MRCFKCSKKVKKFEYDLNLCKCEKNFCNDCRRYDIHNCTYNYKNDKQEILAKENPIVIRSKIIEI